MTEKIPLQGQELNILKDNTFYYVSDVNSTLSSLLKNVQGSNNFKFHNWNGKVQGEIKENTENSDSAEDPSN